MRIRILDLASALPPTKREEVFLGEWSLRDLMAHLIGWDIALLAASQDILVGELPSFYHLRDADWKTLNRQFVMQYNRGDWTELLNAVQDSHAQLLAFLDTVPQDEFTRNHGITYDGSPVTIGRLLVAEIKDERAHYEQIREWAGPAEE